MESSRPHKDKTNREIYSIRIHSSPRIFCGDGKHASHGESQSARCGANDGKQPAISDLHELQAANDLVPALGLLGLEKGRAGKPALY